MKQSRSLSILFITVLLAACGEKATPVPTNTPAPPSATQRATPAPATPTATIEPSPLPTKTPIPTETPWPLGNLGPIAYYDISTNNMMLINADGTELQLLFTRTDISHTVEIWQGFSWSPDGQSLAYASSPWSDIYVYSLKDATARDITNLKGKFENQPDWSPDGSRIAFASDINASKTGKWDIYVMNADGSGIRQLTECPGNCQAPDWSPSGEYITYVSDLDIYVMKANGTGQKRLAHGGINSEPTWSPDGRYIAFIRKLDYETTPYLYLMNSDGTSPKALTDDSFIPERFSWSPDGRFIVFDNHQPVNDLAKYKLWILDVQSGAAKPMLKSSGAMAPAWSPVLITPIDHTDIKPLADCTSGWSRLQAGGSARVTGDVGDAPNRVRSEPIKGENVIGMIQPGTIVRLLEGPVCASGMVFWKIQSSLIPGGIGWTAEGDGTEYWLEPYKP